MKITFAQYQPTKSISNNRDLILGAIKATSSEIIIFPEGMLSGYKVAEKDWLKNLSFLELREAVSKIENLAKERRINVIVGSAWQINDKWYNCGLFININGELRHIYPKINLSTLDRNHFHAGNILSTFKINEVMAAMQICCEVRYPEQWRFLVISGAKIIFHLNNAQKPTDAIWEHLLIARAYENQIFVVSVNAASDTQTLSSLVIDSDGNVLAKTQPKRDELINIDLPIDRVKRDFINERRSDVVDVIKT